MSGGVPVLADAQDPVLLIEGQHDRGAGMLDHQAAEGLFAVVTGTSTDPRTLRLLPPLSFSMDEAEMLVGGLRQVLA